MVTTTSVDLTDPALWANPETPALVAELRREAPSTAPTAWTTARSGR